MTGPNDNSGRGPTVRTRNLCKTYQMGETEVEALRDVTVDIEGGQFSVVLGPSGSGKSTLLHIVGALDRASSGSVHVGDQELESMSEKERNQFRKEKVGFVFQTFNLIENLTALENVLIPFIPGGRYHKMVDRAKKILADVGLENRLEHRPGRLSGGEQQRVAMARALLKDPELVLADEPTGELDSKTGKEIFGLLRNIQTQRQATVIVVTHDTKHIHSNDNLFSIEDGRMNETSRIPELEPEDTN